MKHLIIVSVAIFLSGCTAPTPQYKAPVITLFETPTVGVQTTSWLVDTMLEKGIAVTQTTFAVNAEIDITEVNLALPSGNKQVHGTGEPTRHSICSLVLLVLESIAFSSM